MKKHLFSIFITGFILIFFSCAPATKTARPHFVLISIDTLRGDYFSPEHMPQTYGWAKENCLVFTNAHSNYTWTKPSHVTMLTGQLASLHGVEIAGAVIPSSVSMLQEILKEKGYRTCGFICGGFISEKWGFERGFDEFREIDWSKPRNLQDTGDTFDWAEHYLQKVRLNRPVFLFVHSYMVHQFWADFFPPEVMSMEGDSFLIASHSRFDKVASLETRKKLYADAVRRCDERLFRFITVVLEALPKDNTYLILTSDHGEGLGEAYDDYISLNHTGPPYQDQTTVPLVVYGLPPGKSDKLVGIDDIAGTVLKLAEIENDPEKSLFRERGVVIAEHIAPTGREDLRYIAEIRADGRDIRTVERGQEKAAFTQVEMTDDLKRELRALGYID